LNNKLYLDFVVIHVFTFHKQTHKKR